MTNNVERISMTHQRMIAWAKQKGKPIICWDKQVSGTEWCHLTRDQATYLRENNPELREYFCEGCPATIVKNVKPQAGTTLSTHEFGTTL